MHELGIAAEIFDLLEEISAEQNLKEIKSVTLEIGELSGVISSYLKECWSVASIGSPFEKTALKIIEIPAVALCACGKEFEMMKHSRICPDCKKSDYSIIKGREFTVLQIEAK